MSGRFKRVENGEPSSLDTRRALAGALDFEDIDTFQKPWPFPNVDKLRAYTAEIEENTVLVALAVAEEGRTLRTMIEGAESYVVEQVGDLSSAAQAAFAAIVDYLSEYNDVRDCYSLSQKIEIDREIDLYLKTISDENAVVSAGLRHDKLRAKGDAPNMKVMDWANIFFVLAPRNSLPSAIRVPKTMRMG